MEQRERVGRVMDKKKIELNVSTKNEGTAYPWWAIIDPRQNMRCSCHDAAGQITGPFFSREDAEEFLKSTRYNFSAKAVVYCLSGYCSKQYRNSFGEKQ